MSSLSGALYVSVTAVLSRTLLNSDKVRSVFIRRSVAAGEAIFPLSDVDLSMVVEPVSGLDLARLARRYRIARTLFPRLGECQVFTREDLEDLPSIDPYRTSLDRRVCITVRGEPPAIPVRPIPALQAARRLVFWFDQYIPRALYQGNRRNLNKFALEIANALGVLEGRWPEPLPSRAETKRRCGPILEDPFQFCCLAAAAAHSRLFEPAPRLGKALELPGLVLLPEPRPAFRPAAQTRILTPEALDLLMRTHNPSLWWNYREALVEIGFHPPSPDSWRAYALRCIAPHWLRAPGFMEPGVESIFQRVRAAARILEEPPPPLPARNPRPEEYYTAVYDPLTAWAAEKRRRLQGAAQPAQAGNEPLGLG